MSAWIRERHFKGRQRRPASEISRHRRDVKFYDRTEQYPVTYKAESRLVSCAERLLHQSKDGSAAEGNKAAPYADYTTKHECFEEPMSTIWKEERRRDRSPSVTSSTFSGRQNSGTWDTLDLPTRTDTMDTQASTADDIIVSQGSKLPGTVEVGQGGWQDEMDTDLENPDSVQGDSDSEGEDTPCESSDGELDFPTEEAADAWLVSHFSAERVQKIKAAWTWSTDHGNWIHHDKKTGAIVQWPKDLA